MAKFYGSIKGSRGEATRCGTINSGIKTSVQSWDGSIITALSYDGDNRDILMVEVRMSEGSSA
jgi:hypothetical protein